MSGQAAEIDLKCDFFGLANDVTAAIEEQLGCNF